MAYSNHAGANSVGGSGSGSTPASPATSTRSSVIPPNASSLTFPISPRANVPGYIRRSSAALTSAALSNAGSSSTFGGGSPSIASSSGLRSVSALPSTPGTTASAATTAAGAPHNQYSAATALGPDILERPRDRTRTTEVSASALAFLFAEMVSYTQNRVAGISDLEKKLSLMGYRVGQRVLPMLLHRIEFPTPPSLSSGSSVYNRTPKREVRLLPVLLWLHTQLWKALFGRPADSLERSTEKSDEYMISTNTPLFAKSMSVPREMSQLSVEAFTAGIVEAALDGLGFPARVTAHSVPTPEHPLRTTILVKLQKEIMEREEALGGAS